MADLVHDKVKAMFSEADLCYSLTQDRPSEILFRELLDKIGPFGTAIEIGTHKGLSSAIIAEHCRVLYCFDIEDKPEREKIWKALEVKNALFRRIENDTHKAQIIWMLAEEHVIEFAFVDGDHTLEGIKRDLDLVSFIPVVLVDNVEMPSVLQAVKECGRPYVIHNTYAILGAANV